MGYSLATSAEECNLSKSQTPSSPLDRPVETANPKETPTSKAQDNCRRMRFRVSGSARASRANFGASPKCCLAQPKKVVGEAPTTAREGACAPQKDASPSGLLGAWTFAVGFLPAAATDALPVRVVFSVTRLR
jgi:hypothetical protein